MEATFNPSIESNLAPDNNPQITQQDKESFLKSILVDKPYEEEFAVFDNQLKIRLKSMTVEQNNDVVQQILLDRKADIPSDNDAYFITVSCYRLAQSLVSIDGLPFTDITKETFKPDGEFESYVSGKAKLFKTWSTSRLAIFLDVFKTFEAKVLKLTNEVQTPNFWKASA